MASFKVHSRHLSASGHSRNDRPHVALLAACRLRVYKSVPPVRIQFAPPASLGFDAISEEVRKLRVWRGDARGPAAPEKAQMVDRAASFRFRLYMQLIRCRWRWFAHECPGISRR